MNFMTANARKTNVDRKGLEAFVLLIGKMIIGGMALFGISTIFFSLVATSAPNADKNFLNQTFRHDTRELCSQIHPQGAQQSVSRPVVFDDFSISGEMKRMVFKEQATMPQQGQQGQQSTTTREGPLINASWKNGDWMLTKMDNCDAWGKIIIDNQKIMAVSDAEATLTIGSGNGKLAPNTDYNVRRQPYVSNGQVLLNMTFVEAGGSGP